MRELAGVRRARDPVFRPVPESRAPNTAATKVMLALDARTQLTALELRRIMVVGVLKIGLILAENHSLKGKRNVLRRIQARVANKFNVSVTECGDQDVWQSALLGFGVVGSDARIVDAMLQQILAFVDAMKIAEIGKSDVEVFHC